MTDNLESLKAALGKASFVSIRAKLTRLVPQLDLGPSPDWLFASGKPNRYNPAGVDCVYFGETRDVAQSEYDYHWKGLRAANQPVTTYYAQIDLRRVLDLTSDATLRSLKLTSNDLFTNWRRSKKLTLTQLLGQAVNETRLFLGDSLPFQSRCRCGDGFQLRNLSELRSSSRFSPHSWPHQQPTSKVAVSLAV